ncbi:MAG: DinB family protein [Kofleriaceae bacterium]
MSADTCATLLRQLDIAWQLTSYHLDGLTTEQCLWRPARAGLHVHRDPDGTWRAEWPEREGYDIGPPSIAWLTWHLGFWWSMVIDHSFGSATLAREDVTWPGTAEQARTWIGELHARWRSELERLSDDDLRSTARARWPIQDRPFGDVVAWATIELMKNAAEIGYARFLHAVRT